MAATYENGRMSQGNNTFNEGAQESYQNHGQNYAQENQNYMENPTQKYEVQGHAQEGNSDYYQQQNSNHGEQNGGYHQHSESSQNGNYQHTSGMHGQAGRAGATYPESKAPDTIHIWLDKIEKKFGGERFDEQKHPENAAKNKALNENIIKKLTQVMKIVMQKGPALAMQYGSKLLS